MGMLCGWRELWRKHHDLYIFSLSKTVHFKVLVFDSGYDSGYDSVEITFSYKKIYAMLIAHCSK